MTGGSGGLRGLRLISRLARRARPGAGAGDGAPDVLAAPRRPGAKSSRRTGTTGPATAPLRASEALAQVETTFAKDSQGAVSLRRGEPAASDGVYRNEDGFRVDDGRYEKFAERISEFIPKVRQYTDPVRTFAYGTDASFYRLTPKMVVKVHTEEEISRILCIASSLDVPVTFRAAGTSLAGQAITDSVLLKTNHVGDNFREVVVHGDGEAVTLGPGVIGAEANMELAKHRVRRGLPIQYKIGPDPASIDSCMVGGIVANNASGMCCGVSQNSYNTLRDVRAVFVDGTVLDTSDPASRAAFAASKRDLCETISRLAAETQADPTLVALIRRKFAIKNTTGYSINALVDFPASDPIEIIKHLLVGSEGTLAFLSSVTYSTIPDPPHKASAFAIFPDVKAACDAAALLRVETAVDAIEMFDRTSLKNFTTHQDMVKAVPDIVEAGPRAAGLLIQVLGVTEEELDDKIAEVRASIARNGLPIGPRPDATKSMDAYPFLKNPADAKIYWDVRKGLVPLVGGAREAGTTMLLEDVACPVDKLADMTEDLIDMFKRFDYPDSYVFGHALEGNLHVVFSQGFRTKEEVQRFADLMDDMCRIVAVDHGGSLKSEHGTGRNMAPYVELEWGKRASELMWAIKEAFDPAQVLNPGVVLNRDPLVHLKHIKSVPPADPMVDRCIECGFCESNCPSRDVAISPRQRIAVFKEINRLQLLDAAGETTPFDKARLTDLTQSYEYDGKDMCAADGMCQLKCPVSINTGALIKQLRRHDMETKHQTVVKVGQAIADRFDLVVPSANWALWGVGWAHKILGAKVLEVTSQFLNQISGRIIPVWTPWLPLDAKPFVKPDAGADAGASPAPSSSSSSSAAPTVTSSASSPRLTVEPAHSATPPSERRALPRKVVYMPSCVTRMMGPSALDAPETDPVHAKMLSILGKAGYEVIVPENLPHLCCGMLWNSRGLQGTGERKGSEAVDALAKASDHGAIPILLDTSPCVHTLKDLPEGANIRFAVYDSVEFIERFLVKHLEFRKVRDRVAVHATCSNKKMKHPQLLTSLASRCAHEVLDSNIPCCGTAGDRSMRFPELAAGSLRHLDVRGCSDGYSTSRTCEMSLAINSGISWKSLVYLVDEATSPKKEEQAAKDPKQATA